MDVVKYRQTLLPTHVKSPSCRKKAGIIDVIPLLQPSSPRLQLQSLSSYFLHWIHRSPAVVAVSPVCRYISPLL